jgi:hypothetical protein
VLDAQLEPDLMQVGSMVPALATGHVYDRCLGGLGALGAPIDMATGALKMGKAGCQPQALGGRGRDATVEFRDPIGLAGIYSPAQRIVMELRGGDRWGDEPRGRWMVDKVRDEGQWVVHTAETVEDHRLDGLPGRHEAHGRILLGRLVNDLAQTECFKHASDKAKVI